MSQPVDREGIYRAKPIEWRVSEAQSGAVALEVNYAVQQYLDPDSNEWDEEWGQYEMTITGQTWLVKSDGQANESGIEQAVKALGWSGKFEDLESDSLTLTPCQIQVKAEEYKGQSRLKVAWLNPWDFKPGGKALDGSKLKQLDTRFGAQCRAIAGNAKRNSAPPAPPAKSEVPF